MRVFPRSESEYLSFEAYSDVFSDNSMTLELTTSEDNKFSSLSDNFKFISRQKPPDGVSRPKKKQQRILKKLNNLCQKILALLKYSVIC